MGDSTNNYTTARTAVEFLRAPKTPHHDKAAGTQTLLSVMEQYGRVPSLRVSDPSPAHKANGKIIQGLFKAIGCLALRNVMTRFQKVNVSSFCSLG
jgi:hypothetical protein